MKAKILIVDDEPNNLEVLNQILKQDYELLFALNGEVAKEAAIRHHPHLILLDVSMPLISGFDVCRWLKQHPVTKHIPVIFVTARTRAEDEVKGFTLGAVDYIHKPFSAPIVQRRVETHLRLVHQDELQRSYKETVYMLGRAGHYNDTDTGVHIWRMAEYSRHIALAMGWDKKRSELLELAAPLHDTGKIGIPDSILKAPRKLTEQEWVIMKTHTEIGNDILSNGKSELMMMAAEIAWCHHEKWDGTGYPRGLVGNDIPPSAQIVAVADVFDALSMKRSYKGAWPTDDCIRFIEDQSGQHFNPAVVDAFLTKVPDILAALHYWEANPVTTLNDRHPPSDD
ncbi:two-component system response regulator [Marinobacter mobilis]|uniref:two-component system response regulator n=1 Tax=Marinobacter mobilis TaxID=488533 RepID=UPI0035C6F810